MGIALGVSADEIDAIGDKPPRRDPDSPLCRTT
jgi:hypothetical protein